MKEQIWEALDMIIVYTKERSQSNTPMALPRGSTIRDFAQHIHKDFIRNFRFARVWRRGREIKAGLAYRLENKDVVELYMQ
jgi:ribosome-interacting GTPase 1